MKTKISKVHPTVVNDMVYLPCYKMGAFYGWATLLTKYFSKEELTEFFSANGL